MFYRMACAECERVVLYMKKIFTDFLIGILVFLAVMTSEFLVTLPFGQPENLEEEYLRYVNTEFLLTSLPALLITFIFSWAFQTKDTTSALQRSIIWTAVLALIYLLIGIGNSNLRILFGSFGIYCLLACAFIGPYLYAKVKHLPKKS